MWFGVSILAGCNGVPELYAYNQVKRRTSVLAMFISKEVVIPEILHKVNESSVQEGYQEICFWTHETWKYVCLWFGCAILCISVQKTGWKVKVVSCAVYFLYCWAASSSHLFFSGWETTGRILRRVPNLLAHPDLPGEKLEGETECRCFLPCCNVTGHNNAPLKHEGTWFFCACLL